MRQHTNNFKNEIAKMGRQISGEIYHYFYLELINEDGELLVDESNNNLISEQFNPADKEKITEENIYQMDLIKNGELLKSLMKQFNFETKKDLKIGDVVNPLFGILVDNTYEFLNYGDYIIYSKSYNAANDTYEYVCYDLMLYSMIPHCRLNISYPITVKQYIEAIAQKMGLAFANENETFTNYDELIKKDYFIDNNVTFRDILDKLSEITASNILINDNNELQIGYINNTDDVIDETNLKNINVNFSEKFGTINKIMSIDSEKKENYIAQDDISIEENGLTEIDIIDNQIILNGDQQKICQNILNKLNGVYYSVNDFSTTGICYYDFLDMFQVKLNNVFYQCLLLNNEIKISQGIEENIFTDKKNNSKDEKGNYENNNLTNKEVQQKFEEINEKKVENKSIINSINESKEENLINVTKLLFIKKITETTDSDGFLNVYLNENNIIVSATASFSNNQFGFVIPYFSYNSGKPKWYLKIEDKNKNALANYQITVTIYYFRKPKEEN